MTEEITQEVFDKVRLYRDWLIEQTAKAKTFYTDPFSGEVDPVYQINFFHKQCITATMSSVLLDANPYKNKQELFNEVTFVTDDRFVDDDKRFTFALGHAAEPLIAKEFARVTHIKVGAGCTINDANHNRPYAGCQIDFLTIDKEPMECKTASHSAGWGRGCIFNENGDILSADDRIPFYYMIQCQKQMWIAGVQQMWLSCWLTFERGLRIYRLTADPELQQKINDADDDFLFNHLIPNVGYEDHDIPAPAPLENDANTCFANDEFNALLTRYKELKEPYKTVPVAVRKEMNEITDKLKELMGDATHAVDANGKELCHFTSSQGKPTFNEKAFANDHPDMYKEYMQEGKISTKFFITKEKK